MAMPGALGQVQTAVFGSGDDPGILGVGKYNPNQYNVNESAFTDNHTLSDLSNAFQAKNAMVQARQAPSVQGATLGGIERVNGAQLNLSNADQIRSQQMNLAQALQNQMNGTGAPSVAQLQLQQGLQQNLAAAMAAQASARGGAGGGLALRQIQNQRGNLTNQANQQAAILRAQEMQAAQGQLAGVLGQTRGMDQDVATQQAALMQQANLANAQAFNVTNLKQGDFNQQAIMANQAATMKQQEMNDAMGQFYDKNQWDVTIKNQQNLQDLEKLKAQQSAAMEQMRSQAYQNAGSNRAGVMGAAGQGLAAVAAMSDKKLKTKIKPGDKALAKLLGSMSDEDEKTDKEDGTDPLKNFLKGFSSSSSSGPQTNYQKEGAGISSAFGALAKKKPATPDDSGATVGGNSVVPQAGQQAAWLGTPKFKGGVIPGDAPEKGDSPKNDSVPILASPGEAIIPRSAMQDPKKLQEFVDSLKAHQYSYKDEKHGEGTYLSPMAQELEKSELGKHMVIDTPEGKMVHYGRAGGVMLATAAMLNDRMNELENAFKSRKK